MLYRFHVVLVASGIVFSFGFALYEIFRAPSIDSYANFLVAAASFAGGVGLVRYLQNIRRSGIRS